MMSHSSLRSGGELGARPPRRRHPWRWVLGGLLTLVVIVVVAVIAVVGLEPSQPPLALPAGVAAAPAGQLNGTWHVTTGSVAGFRVREILLGFGKDMTGRTRDVTGNAVLGSGQVASATFRVSLNTIAVDGKTRQPQLVKSLGTAAHPVATVTLTGPLPLPVTFSSGATITRAVAATLTLDGITRPVTVTLSARRVGPEIEAAGSLPVAFTAFGIKGPAGYGFLGSLASDGAAEFLLVLTPSVTG
jgi:polyisoprenoid-binding protein YceI